MNQRLFSCFLVCTAVGFGCEQTVGDHSSEAAADVSQDTGSADTGMPVDTGVAVDTGPVDTGPVGPKAHPCGSDMDCNDDILCTQDLCETSTATCSHVPVNALCEDDGSPCLLSVCIPGTGCLVDPDSRDGLACDDGDACSSKSLCEDGSCVATEERDCDDGNPCTDDVCDAGVGCVQVFNANPCNDSSDFTTGDHCVSGVCTGSGGVNCLTPADCNDGNPCTALTCSNGHCISTGSTCDDGLACTVDACDPALGCTNTPKDSLCDDGEWCVPSLMGIGGTGCTQCTTPNDSKCDDKNVCTIDSCVDGTCQHVPVEENIACDDADACTVQSFCIAGVCVGGDPKNCEDGLACTINACHPDLGCYAEIDACGDPAPPVNPQLESCNGVDDDGDGYTDEPGAQGCIKQWWDGDGDSYGKAGQPQCTCFVMPGYTGVPGDCNDSDPALTTDCSGGGNPPPPVDPAKSCTVRLTSSEYELHGWSSALLADQCVTDSEGSQWCVDVAQLKVYGGGGVIIANAKCDPGATCNQAGTVWGVGYTGVSCKSNELVTLQGLFDVSADCDCHAACIDGTQETDSFGDPNLYCTVKP